MHVMLAWYAQTTLPESVRRSARERCEALLGEVVPATFRRHEFGGDDWGVTVLHPGDAGAYRWSTVATAGPTTAVSLGLPVGLDVTGGPAALARRLLAGEDVHREVVPPFGLLALDGDRRFALQQDWLGMCRVFTGTAGGVTAFCTRPSPLAAFLHGDIRPDLDGWASYTLCGHFGGDRSPVAGTRLLRPGERVTGRRRDGGGWDVTTATGYSTDDVVMSGFTAQGRRVDDLLDGAAASLTATAASVARLYRDEITLGLSGGKDSRLIAASLIAAGHPPRFATNEDSPAEGEVARELVRILRDSRGLRVDHRLWRAGAPANVLAVGLRERTRRLQRLHDFQFPSSYLTRRAVAPMLSDEPRTASFTGAAGELATGYWYPPDEGAAPSPEQAGKARLLAAVPGAAAAGGVVAAERDRITAVLGHARDIGLADLHLVDYLYLVERMRRWCTSAAVTGMVTPFLAPGFVAATFALTPRQKRDRALHTALIARLAPEWAEVPYVSAATGPSTAARVWEGDGVETIADLLDTAQGTMTGFIARPAVEKALRTAARGGRPDPRTLAQFTWLALASHQLDPASVRPSTAATYARITASPPPPRRRPVISRLRWIRRTRLGDRLWVEVRKRVRAR